MNNYIWIIVALAAGALLPIQAGLNTRLGKTIENPVYASLISFVIGTIALALYVVVTKQHVTWAGIKTAPFHIWLGGILGAFYVTAIVIVFPKIGPALTFGLIVTGQMVISVLLDHTNILVAEAHSFSLWRLVGIILIVAGVVILRRF
ncbi:DMT family transporter [Chryseosolibacter indicus]|uniref:DMT family transporter n=1 Tax=Chryseosolibacter indicus TaxID=2782351 RepID=A0ABS5VLH2_9BACT|nr:DMT family transporter [Chryseosolibacter indicus]MBT1702303.1 DMT family transporter [Chryseosolibacter indicus]